MHMPSVKPRGRSPQPCNSSGNSGAWVASHPSRCVYAVRETKGSVLTASQLCGDPKARIDYFLIDLTGRHIQNVQHRLVTCPTVAHSFGDAKARIGYSLINLTGDTFKTCNIGWLSARLSPILSGIQKLGLVISLDQSDRATK